MLKRIVNFYYEGFTGMTTGKTLWTVIIIKLVIIFAVMRMFFMPDILSERAGDGGEADYVATQILEKANENKP